MKIVVVGAGYVGLSLACLLAKKHDITITDIDKNKINLLKAKISPIKDKDIQKSLKKLNIKASINTQKAVINADFIIIATPTNYDENTNFFNTSSVESVIKIAKSSKATIVIKSTIPVGFTEQIQKKFNIKKLLFSPEFLREGQALKDNLYPSRIIVSYPGHLPKLKNKAKIFANMLKKASLKENVPVIITKSNEAEAIKLFANTYLALRVAYFNELDTFAAIKNLNTKDIINGVCADPRIGDFYNNPSFGYGGYCLPKDSKQLLANYSGVPQNIIQAIIQANQTRKTFIANEIIKSGAKIIGVYHLAMKSNSDNYRNSAILDIANILKQNNLEVIIYEPSIKDAEFSGFKVLNDFKEFEAKSELIIANRTSNEIIKNKLYTRDIFKRD